MQPHAPNEFTPLDADFAARVRDSFARQAAMALIGADLVEVTAGRVHMTLAHSGLVTQQHGFIHAGVLTIEFKVNLLAPARGPVLQVEGLVTKAGRTISVADGCAWQPHPTRAGQDQLVATLTATLMTVLDRDDVRH